MRTIRLGTFFAISVFAAAGPFHGELAAQAGPGPRTVQEFTDAFVSAVRVWDVDAWSALVSEDVVMMAPNGRKLEGREAFRELWARTFAGQTGRNPLKVVVNDSVVEGDLAVVRADYGPEGADPVGQYVWMLRRDGRGVWVLSWWIFNRVTTQGTDTPEEVRIARIVVNAGECGVDCDLRKDLAMQFEGALQLCEG